MKIVEDHTVDEQSNLDKSLLSSKRQFSGKKSNNQHVVKTPQFGHLKHYKSRFAANNFAPERIFQFDINTYSIFSI